MAVIRNPALYVISPLRVMSYKIRYVNYYVPHSKTHIAHFVAFDVPSGKAIPAPSRAMGRKNAPASA